MQIPQLFYKTFRGRVLIAGAVFAAMSLLFTGYIGTMVAATETQSGRLVTFYDRGQKRVVLTHAHTVQDALKTAKLSVSTHDVVEPAVNSELVAENYNVNIYRARPVIVVDGAVRQKVMTAAQTPEGIVAATGGQLRSEDNVTMTANDNVVIDGASTILTIDRATRVTLKLYGTVTTIYTQAATVGSMLEQKGIKLAVSDTVSVDQHTPITPDMTIEIWREGVQTATVEEEVAYPVRIIQDADQPIGYRAVQTPGVNGKKNVVYEITAQGGKEVGRKVIQSIVTTEPKEQIEIIGVKPGPNALTKSKGAQTYTDAKGVAHRETYYDLPMNIVMGACGGGTYTIRADGAKVDKDGYILVAANLVNYPRCSIVETSIGLGKVYDTGGFAAVHPHGFDLATDWTNNDGR